LPRKRPEYPQEEDRQNLLESSFDREKDPAYAWSFHRDRDETRDRHPAVGNDDFLSRSDAAKEPGEAFLCLKHVHFDQDESI